MDELADMLADFQASAAYVKLQAIVEEYHQNDAAAVAGPAEAILKICEEHGYAYERVFRVKEIGALPFMNFRFTRAHVRASKIKREGCSQSILEKSAVATEDDPRTRYIAKYTASLQFKDPRFARYFARKTSKSEIWVQRTPHMALLAFRTKFLAPSRTYPRMAR